MVLHVTASLYLQEEILLEWAITGFNSNKVYNEELGLDEH